MIRLEIIDPQNLPRNLLIDTAAYLMKIAGAELKQAPHPEPSKPSKPMEPLPLAPLTAIEPKPAFIPLSEMPINPKPAAEEELDSQGNKWDSKIHTRTKSKNADGTWKTQRGLTTPACVQVEPLVMPPALSDPVVNLSDPIAPVIDLGTLMNKITSAIAANKLTHAAVTMACQNVGLQALPLLGTRPELIPAVSDAIDKLIGG